MLSNFTPDYFFYQYIIMFLEKKMLNPKDVVLFCNEFKHSLSRHFKLMHENEPEVSRTSTLPCDDRRRKNF
ncbi:hypothetical protein Avbf_15545 [Armadillidium vulgare]|nr:hypothetical protein Avbf_15545 [Armadillidium vulgare]